MKVATESLITPTDTVRAPYAYTKCHLTCVILVESSLLASNIVIVSSNRAVHFTHV